MKLVNSIFWTALLCHNIVNSSALSLTPPKSKKQILKSKYSGNSDQENINGDIFLSGGRFFNFLQTFCRLSFLIDIAIAGGEQKDEHVNCTDSPGYKCVPYYLCEDPLIPTYESSKDTQVASLRVNPDEPGDSCVGFLDVCCKDPSQPKSAATLSPDTNAEVKNTDGENCSDQPGYWCVPYNLCDYEEQTKIPLNCPGFLNVCCKDPHPPLPPRSNSENKMISIHSNLFS